jgi:hypothetical protein
MARGRKSGRARVKLNQAVRGFKKNSDTAARPVGQKWNN